MIASTISIFNYVTIVPLSQVASYTDEIICGSHWWIAIIIIPLFILATYRRYFRASISKQKHADFGRGLGNRMKELADWAQSKGLSFNPAAGVMIAGRYWHLNCLQKGENHYAYNVIEGFINNRKVCAFDYHYETAYIDKRRGQRIVTGHYYFSAVVVETQFDLKPLFIRTENVLDQIAESAGLNDIDFESIEFNQKFHVKSSDRRWAYDVVNQANIELLLNSCHFNLEFNGNYIIAYRDDLFSPGYFEDALQLLTGIVDNLPKPLLG